MDDRTILLEIALKIRQASLWYKPKDFALTNASSHRIEKLSLANIKVFFLPPNTNSKIQPIDVRIIVAFKKRYYDFKL